MGSPPCPLSTRPFISARASAKQNRKKASTGFFLAEEWGAHSPVELRHGLPGLGVFLTSQQTLQNLLLHTAGHLLFLYLLPPLLRKHHCRLHQLAHHLVHVSAVEADLRELTNRKKERKKQYTSATEAP